MKSLKEIYEASILGNIDDNMKAGNKIMKKQKELQDIRDNFIYLDALWHGIKSTSNATDEWGNVPEIGDIVMFKSGKNFIVCVVIETHPVNKDVYKLATATINGLQDMITDENPFYDTVSSWYKLKDFVIIAKKKNAKQMLKLLTKLL